MTLGDRKLTLKPCPCCGGQAIVIKSSGRSALHTPYWSGYVKCKSCQLMTPMCKSPGAMERIWNKRFEGEEGFLIDRDHWERIVFAAQTEAAHAALKERKDG